MRPQKPTVSDHNLIHREIYNPNDFAIEFRRMNDRIPYIFSVGIMPGPDVVICDPRGRIYLPHMYYVPTARNHELGQPFEVVQIFGSDIGKGLRAPSAPGRDW